MIENASQRLTELQLGFNYGTRIGSSYLNLELGYQKDIGALEAQNNQHPKGSEPVARYKKYNLTASFLKPFKFYEQHFSFDSLLYYQKSEDILFSPQRISLGGISSVRGLKDQSLSSDSGGYCALDKTRPDKLAATHCPAIRANPRLRPRHYSQQPT